MFNDGRTNVHDEKRSWRPSVIAKDLKRIDEHIRTSRPFTLDEINDKFPQFSRSVIHEMVMENLHYKKKNCATWVPRMLTQEHYSKHTGAAFDVCGEISPRGW
jgi:hypothetical protein